jgi:hypothetical protein
VITLVHGGQTGVDRGAHDAAVEHGWQITGYMPRDGRDELGPIPPEIARFLIPHASAHYAARTAANVAMVAAILVVVRDAGDPRATPGTTKTINLARDRRVVPVVVDPSCDVLPIASWLYRDLLAPWPPLTLPLAGFEPYEPEPPARLLVAGPRESKWPGARAATADLLRRIVAAVGEITAPHDGV